MTSGVNCVMEFGPDVSMLSIVDPFCQAGIVFERCDEQSQMSSTAQIGEPPMTESRSRAVANRFGTIGMFILTFFVALIASATPASAEVKNVKIMLDWIIQGTHAPFFVALQERRRHCRGDRCRSGGDQRGR
jgi:hypothetical protein